MEYDNLKHYKGETNKKTNEKAKDYNVVITYYRGKYWFCPGKSNFRESDFF